MEQMEQAVQPLSKRRVVIISAVVLLLLIASGLIGFLRAQQVAAARHARYVAAQNALSALLFAGKQVQSAKDDLITAQVAYYSDYKQGSDASQKRHDNGVSDAPDLDYMYAEAQTEYNRTNKLSDDNQSIDSAFEDIANAFAAHYGDQAVAKLRSNIRSANEASEDVISSWNRAAGEVKDYLQQREEGNFWASVGSDNEGLYQASSDADARAERYWTDANSDIAILQKRLDADTAKARANLNALPK